MSEEQQEKKAITECQVPNPEHDPANEKSRQFLWSGPHHWSWIWHGNTWTHDRRCTTCGKVERNVRKEDGSDTTAL